jgi:hypothetical protein
MTRKPRKAKRTKSARRARKPPRPAGRDPLDALIATGAQSLDLTLDPKWTPAVREHLRVILRLGAQVAAFALPDDTEPAPVFEA